MQKKGDIKMTSLNEWDYHLARIDSRYPNIKKHYPDAKFMDLQGHKFKSKDDALAFRKKQVDYVRRVHKPKIKLRMS